MTDSFTSEAGHIAMQPTADKQLSLTDEEFQQQAISMAVVNIFSGSFFDVSKFNTLMDLKGKARPAGTQSLQLVHCMYYKDMTPEFLAALRCKVAQALELQ